MIAGLADAGRIFRRPDYLAKATQGADFILQEMQSVDGRLLRSFTSGQRRLQGYLDDYAFFIHGLLRMHEATGENRWLAAATVLLEKQIELFRDEVTGVFVYTAKDQKDILFHFSDPVDGAIPSGNSMTVSNLIYLTREARLTDTKQLARFQQVLNETMLSAIPSIENNPTGSPLMVTQFSTEGVVK
jgi:uncharacterized protein YyaL (SSP411 family)